MANIAITGANQGIGYFFTEQLLKDGNKVAVFDLEAENLKKLKTIYGNKLLYYLVDVRNVECLDNAVNDVISEFGCIDIAVHNACKCTYGAEADTDFDTYREVLEVNYFGALGLAKHINSRRFIICHSMGQKIQTLGCYLFPIKMGNLLSKLTENLGG